MNNFSLKIKQLFKLSRPRFWFYLGGPFMVGFVAGVDSLQSFNYLFFVLLFYFLIPANIMLYGVNDIADEAVDVLNSKKEGKEMRVDEKNRNFVKFWVILSLVVSMGVFFFISKGNYLLMTLFLFLSVFYSLHPMRFKTIPFLDFLSNTLYIMPGIIAFYEVTKTLPNIFFILSAVAWAGAMHLFSAILDIEPDKKAGIMTTAVFLGLQKSLWLCFILWFFSWVLVFSTGFLGNLIYVFLIYPILPLYILINKKADLNRIYWLYPYINTILGFILFMFIFKKLF
ncbi:MAG: prenyltransferase [Candidatus Nomurabacteria bacterium]|nr:prenyltransferase [Candidatus Nomurabacteria bacterium]